MTESTSEKRVTNNKEINTNKVGGIIMRTKKYTHGITFFMTPQMYEDIRKLSDQREVSISEVFRNIVSEYLERHQLDENERPNA
jgi:hypothetical protein